MKLWFGNRRFSLRFFSAIFYPAILVFACLTADAQPGCPAVSAGNNILLPCGTNCTNLTAVPFQVGSTNSYSVSPIPYTPFSYSAGTPIALGLDDYWSDTINLPFNFCFFGNVYNQAVVGANGIITFNTYRALMYNPWSLTACLPVPDSSPVDSSFTNTIMGPYQDIDPALGGTITYQLIGSAPCRILVVSYNQVPMYNTSNCPGNNCTCQIAIYETTNAIEIYIESKQFCSAWNNGLGIEGIMNSTGTVAYTVAGRNLTQWNASNDAYRFTPNGPSIVSVSWYQGATQISNDSTAHVCPPATTTYTAKAVYIPCAGGVPVTVTDNVTVSLTGTLNAGVDSTRNVSCFGHSDGSAYAHVSGGTPPVTYGWSTGSTALSINNLPVGTYSFSVTDGGGCQRIDTFVIRQSSPISVTAMLTNPACHGGCNGVIATIDTGGNGSSYNYLWNTAPVQTTQTATNLCAGSYKVTVTDNGGCSGSASFTLTSPPVAVVNQVSITNVSCRGESNGSIVVSAGVGFNGSVSFQWSNGQAGVQDTALAAGNYTVTATDSLGCSATAIFMVTQPATGISIQPPLITNILCFGDANGAITANATGGAGNLTYSWNQVSTGTTMMGQAINNLGADTYQLTVADANGCYDTTSYVLTDPPPFVFDSLHHNGVICASVNGQAQVYVHGGTNPYTYKWSNNPPVATAVDTGLSGGSYSVTVTDASGCSVSSAFSISQATPILIPLANQDNVLCMGGADGSITVNVNGGIPPYQFSWSNGVFTMNDSSLTAGIYSISVTDSNSCSATASYTITQPNALTSGTPNIQNIGCAGGLTGVITANPAGGTQAYTYAWVQQSNNQTYSTQTISNLGADVYNLTITDAHGCSVTAGYTVTAVVPLVYSIDSANVSCANGNNGSLKVSIISGRPPYQFLWDNTVSSDSVYSNLSAGLVDVIVRDADNCSGENIVNILQPSPLVIQLLLQTNVSCNGGDNGKLSINVSGGTPGYGLLWSNQFTGSDDSALVAGNYTVTVTDANACSISQTYLVTQPTPLVAAPISQMALCYGSADGYIDANPSGGTPPYSFLWSDGSLTQVDRNLVKGAYACTIEDALGCLLTISDTVGQPTLVVTADSVTAVKCVGQQSGTAFIYPAGGYPPYDYNATRDGVNFIFPTNGVILGLDTGIYNVRITDSMGCINQITIYIPPAIPDSFSTAVDSTLCYGPNYNDGAALVTVYTLQNGPYTFVLDGGVLQDTGYFQNLSAGLHLILATNAKGCAETIPVVVPQPLPIVVEINPDSVTLTLGGSQSVLVTYQNATDVSYNWTPSAGLSCVDCPNPVINPYTSGDYMLVVSMQNGPATCYDTTYLHVFVLPPARAYYPNAFSPNGDGNNDRFMIYGEDIKSISLKIFNRWGEEVYATINSLTGWDGTYKGVLQSIGVYTYEAVVTFLDDSQETKKGTVTLIR